MRKLRNLRSLILSALVVSVASLVGVQAFGGTGYTDIGVGGNSTSLQGVAVSSTAPGSNQCLVYNSGTTVWEPNSCSSGSGDVVGPASAVDSQIVLFNSTTGKLVKAGVKYASTNTATTVVERDGSGNFSAGTITAALTGNVTGDVTGNVTGAVTGNVTGNCSGTAATITGNLTGPVTSTGMATTIDESYVGMIETPIDKTYVIDLYAAFGGTINTLKIITLSGTTTAAVKINGTSVTGISAVSVSSTMATANATAARTFVSGDKLTLVLSSSSTPVDMSYTLSYTR